MTRAISCIFHGHFKRAFQYNKLIIIVFPLLCHTWLQGVTTEYKKLHHKGQGEREMRVSSIHMDATYSTHRQGAL